MTRRLSFALALAFSFSPASAFASVSKGQKAPDFRLTTLKGQQLSLSSLRGKVVLLDFWAQWCEPCKQELPELQKLHKEYASRGVVIVGVNIDKLRENAERLVRQLGITFDVALDPAGSVAGTFDLPKMPTSFVVDKKGTVRFVNEGFDGPKDVDRFRKELDEVLK
jgi:peroxiredoxin